MSKASPTPRRGRVLYIIEIQPKWHPLVAPNLAAGKSCFYVGETGKKIEKRYEQHLQGISSHAKSSSIVTSVDPFKSISKQMQGSDLVDGVDIVLLPELTADYRPRTSKASSERAEAVLIDCLRRAGNVTYPPSKKLTRLPFLK
jgi:hypothetical protein